MSNYKQKNYEAKLEAINALKSKYFTILLPLNELGDFDIVGLINKQFDRIKVIYCDEKATSGVYQVNLRVSGGYNKSNTLKKPFDKTSCEWLYIKTPEASYFIPTHILSVTRSLNLSKEYLEYKI